MSPEPRSPHIQEPGDDRQSPGIKPEQRSPESFAVVWILATVAVVAIAGVAFWAAGPVAGLVVIVATIAAIVGGFGLRTERRGPVAVARTPDDERRVLVLANEEADGRLAHEIETRSREDETTPLSVHVVVPALASRSKQIASDVDEPREEAFERLQASILELSGKADRITGEVGASDPRLALEDALRTHGADEVITFNPPDEEMSDELREATERALREVPRPSRKLTASH
jgi:hypothetical protein